MIRIVPTKRGHAWNVVTDCRVRYPGVHLFDALLYARNLAGGVPFAAQKGES